MPYPEPFKFGSNTMHPPQEIKTADTECVHAERNIQYAEKRLRAVLDLINNSLAPGEKLPPRHARQLAELKRTLKMLNKILGQIGEATRLLDFLNT